jgi:hypothetical protein
MRSGNYQTRPIPHLAGGLNEFDNQQEIEAFEMADCENIEVDEKIIRTAGGYVGYNKTATSGPYWGAFHAKFQNGSNILIRQRQNKLEYDSDGNGDWLECTLPTTGSPASTISLTQIPCRFEMLNDIVLWTNGTDDIMSSTDGITWTLQSSLPKSKVILNNGKNRILFLAQTAIPSRIDWSDINDPLTISGDAFQFIGKNDGQAIVDGVLTPRGSLLIFKSSRFYEISDITADTVAVDPVGEAPIIQNTAVATENSVIWAGFDGIYEFNGGSTNHISGNLDRGGRNDWTYPAFMRATYFNHKYRLACPYGSNSYNSQEYVINRSVVIGKPKNPYSITRNQRYIGCYCIEDREISNIRRRRLYFGDSRKVAEGSPASVPGVFAWINDNHDEGVVQGLNGSAQECYFTTKFFHEETPFLLKRYVKMFISAIAIQDSTFTLGYRFDPEGAWNEKIIEIVSEEMDWEYDDLTTGGWSEGFGWAYLATQKIFVDLEKDSEPNGIQFKISTNQINDLTFFSMAHRVMLKSRFH